MHTLVIRLRTISKKKKHYYQPESKCVHLLVKAVDNEL